MKNCSKILISLLAAWVLMGAQFSAPSDVVSPTAAIAQADGQEEATPGNHSRSIHDSAPFWPGTLAETEQQTGNEIEPDSQTGLKHLSHELLLYAGSIYLKASEQTQSFHPALKLIYPFHTRL